MKFGKWILAASALMLLTSCGGAGGGAGGGMQSAAVQSLLENATNLEMTDRYLYFNLVRELVTCSGTDCESSEGRQFGLSYHAEWLGKSSSSGPAVIGDDDNAIYRLIRRLGQHSGYYAIRFDYANTGAYIQSFSAAFGGPERKPVSGTGVWTGNMGGHHVSSGTQVTGKSTVTYSFGDNTVDVRLYDISGPGFSGEQTFGGISVKNDGSFSSSSISGYVAGNFYGPNSEETTGIFEDPSLVGAWFADR